MRHVMAMLLVVCAAGCKADKEKPADPAPAAGDQVAPAKAPTAGAGDETPGAKEAPPALPSIGDDPSPARICRRLAAAAAAEGGEAETKWKELAPDCEKNLAEAMTSRVEKYTAFASCMRDKTTFTAVMNDCRQLE
jgi:hypothetical protein